MPLIANPPGGRPYQQRYTPPLPPMPERSNAGGPEREPEEEGDTEIVDLGNGREVEYVADWQTPYDPATNSFGERRLIWKRGKSYNQRREAAQPGVAASISAGSREREGAKNRAAKAEEDRLDRESKEAIAALNAAIDQIKAQETESHNRAQEELAKGNLEESKRQFDLSHELGVKRHELETNKFDWEKRAFETRSGLEEQRNRIQEAQVTGYYRPSKDTPFTRPVSDTALAASAPTLAREQWAARRATQPGAALARAPQPQAASATAASPAFTTMPTPAFINMGSAQQPSVAKQPAPQNTAGMTLADLSKQYQTQQTGPPATGLAAQAPQSQPNEQPVQQQAQRLKREIREYF